MDVNVDVENARVISVLELGQCHQFIAKLTVKARG